MADLEELELNRSPMASDGDQPSNADEPSNAHEPSNRSKWIVLAVMLIVAAAAIGYVVLRRQRPQPAATVAPISEPAPIPRTEAPRLEGDRIPLPALQETDPLVRDLLVKLSSHPRVLAWLATNGLIENFAVVTLNMSEGRTPVTHLQALAPTARFRVRSAAGRVFLDSVSYQRYDETAAAVDGIDATGIARLYLTLKPRILDAYRALGYPDGDFDPVLEKAIAGLLAVPSIDGDIPVREEIISYEFVNPDLEALSPAQKQLLRMGPRNIRLVQQKLRQIAMLLGLRPDQAPSRTASDRP